MASEQALATSSLSLITATNNLVVVVSFCSCQARIVHINSISTAAFLFALMLLLSLINVVHALLVKQYT